MRWSMDEIEERKGYHVNGPRPFLFLDERGLPLKIWYNFFRDVTFLKGLPLNFYLRRVVLKSFLR